MNHIFSGGNIEQPGIAIRLLENPGNVHIQDFFLFQAAQRFDKIITGQNPVKIVIIKNPVAGTGQAHGYACNNDTAGIEIKLFNGLKIFLTLSF